MYINKPIFLILRQMPSGF